MYTVAYTLNKNRKSVVVANRCKLCKFNNDRGILQQVQKPKKAVVVKKKRNTE